MKKFFALLLFLIPSLCPALEKFTPGDSRFLQFEEYLEKMVNAYNVPGMAFFITDKNDTLFSKTYGECTSPDQQFFIGSMSKSYTALCIMQLYEKGLINLDEDFTTYLPEYKFEKPITVRNLLNHTSGFDTHMKFSDVKITETYGKYEYANINYDLLGKIIEKVSGMSFEDYITQNVFMPLGMNDTIADSQKAKGSAKLLKGNKNLFGFFKSSEAEYPTEKSWFHEPAGYLGTTPSDHAKYLRMYLNDGLSEQGKQIITKESINSMWYEFVPLGDNFTYYGKGWNYASYDGLRIVFHGGQVETGITYMFIVPDLEIAICFMINGNDEFGMNSLMDNAFWSSLAIIRGNNPSEPDYNAYTRIHLIFNSIYLVILLISVFVLIKGIKQKEHDKKWKKITAGIFDILGFIVWPFMLPNITGFFVDTPLWVIHSYVPDLYFIIITGTVLAFAGGLIFVARKVIPCLKR